MHVPFCERNGTWRSATLALQCPRRREMQNEVQMIGSTISHYKILEKLGEGGMGIVYKALDTTLGRTVALKFISASASADESLKQRLAREAKACAALNHPNITTVYDFVETDEHEFIAMEFVEGESLDKILEAKQFDVAEAIPLVLQLLDGLEAAHRKGITHRDLKASNIMLDADGRLKIMDFGLAKFAQGSMLTQLGSTVGTAAYMSPEQARGEETDHRTDIYSVGVVVYQLLTGKIPFPHAHQLAILYSVVNEAPKPPRDLNLSIPPAVEAIVLKAMAKNPDERFQSCAEMAESLLEVSEGVAGGVSLRKRFRHLVEGTGAASGVSSSSKTEQSFLRSRYSRLGVPALVVVLTLAYVIVKTFPPFEGDSLENPEKYRTDAARSLAKKHNDSASVLMQANRADVAAQELERAIEADSTFGAAWANLALINMRAQRPAIAEKQLWKAIALDKKAAHMYCYNIAYACEERGDKEEAMAWYSESIAADSSFAPAYCAVANLYVKSNRPNDALRLLVRFERLNSESSDRWLVYRSYGKAHLALQNFRRAKEVLEESNRLHPNDPETLFLLSMAYDSLKMDKESLATLREYASIEKDPAKLAGALLRIKQLERKTH